MIHMKQTLWDATRHEWGSQLETQLMHVKQTPWAATDTIS